jgi:hypothetical protein
MTMYPLIFFSLTTIINKSFNTTHSKFNEVELCFRLSIVIIIIYFVVIVIQFLK